MPQPFPPSSSPSPFQRLLAAASASNALVLRGGGRTFDSAGVRLRYFDAGAGEPVVLLHGFSRSAAAWAVSGIARDLARDHRAIAIDCRGHGRSGKPTDPAAYGAAMADDVVRLLDRLGIGAAHVAGHSMGGRIALKLAAVRPDRVRSAVLIGSGGTLDGFEPCPCDRLAESLERGAGLGPLLAAVWPSGRPLPPLRAWLLSRAAMLTNDPRALAAVARGYRGLTVSDAELADLRVPVAAVVGSDDPYLRAVEALAARVPGLPVSVVPGGTHLDILLRPETRLTLRSWLADHRGSQPAGREGRLPSAA